MYYLRGVRSVILVAIILLIQSEYSRFLYLSSVDLFEIKDAPIISPSNKAQRQMTVHKNQEEDLSDCEAPLGNDVCITGQFYGNNFNRMMSVANALYEVELQSNGTASPGVLRLSTPHMKWFESFFQPENDRIHPVERRCMIKSCHYRNTWKHFFWYHTTKFSNTTEQRQLRLQKHRLNMFALFGMWKKGHLYMADQIFNFYRQQYPNKYLISVHQRWIEGTCPSKARRGMNACIDSGLTSVPEIWVEACQYTHSFVRDHLPSKYTPENSVLILMGDGQLPGVEKSFPIRDRSPFPVQVVLMTMSDYHVGNPQSTVDASVAYWRRGKKTFPENCYRYYWEAYLEDAGSLTKNHTHIETSLHKADDERQL